MIIGYHSTPFSIHVPSSVPLPKVNRSMSLSTPPLNHDVGEVDERVMPTLLVLNRHGPVCSLWAAAYPHSPLG